MSSFRNNRFERLPPELRYYIAEFIASKGGPNYPYIKLFKDIMLDWYNKYRVLDNSTVVYRKYDEIYIDVISQEDAPYFKHAFKHYRYENKYYYMPICNYVGQFIKIARPCPKKNKEVDFEGDHAHSTIWHEIPNNL